MKGVRKGMAKGAKTFDDLGKKLSKKLRFKKFRIRVQKRRFKLEGEVNPWVLLANGEVKHVKADDPRVKGKRVGSKVKMDKGSDAKWNKEKDGVLVGWQDSEVGNKLKEIDDTNLNGSKYVQDLNADEAKAIDEFAELTDPGMSDELRGNRIRGGAKSERVSLRKSVREEIFKNADSGRTDANGYKIYLDQKTGLEIPNYGKYYPKKTPLGHPHPKAGQKVPENLVGKPRADIGHTDGNEWKKRLEEYKKEGRTREEIIELENDPSLYGLEERSSNRSRKVIKSETRSDEDIFKSGWNREKVQEIPKGSRPHPREYLREEIIKSHAKKFKEEGASFIVVKSWTEGGNPRYISLPPKKFVGLQSEMDEVLNKYNMDKDWTILRDELNLGKDVDLSSEEIFYVKISPENKEFKFDIPDGNELGAIEGEWVPGGKTKSGISEASLIGSEKVIHNKDINQLLEAFGEGNWEKIK
ncbi:GH-E family nuclease [Mangrovivirga cuniculi]|uniref:Toxin YqcG C-terminal domain-containing protein n=1 Tax=Mangrovivirga cuniculi TaxID=2715131 RepID=A0A4D7JIK9_9BACT|nr:GH-E family nuclease [Mangrovivirga cuniculi]QCK14823.1 hypothetical protein DCC35_08760 [Mangrovivirga cuniculi]